MPLLFTIFGLMLIHAKPEQTAQNDAVPAEIARAGGMPELVRRFSTDRSALRRFYPINLSETRLVRMERFLKGWRTGLNDVDFDRAGRAGQIDYIMLRNELDYAIADIGHQRKKFAASAALRPFAQTIIDLEEARQRMEPVDSQESAIKLASITTSIKELRKRVKKGLKAAKRDDKKKVDGEEQDEDEDDDPDEALSPLEVAPDLAQRAADEIAALQRSLKTWFSYNDGFQPEFTWWAKKPYNDADKALTDYAKFLREEAAGIKGEDDDPLIGDPVGRDDLLSRLRHEMIPYTPEQLLTIGQREFAWCEAEMKKAAAELGHDDWSKALEQVKTLHVGPGEQDDLVKRQAQGAIEFLDEHDLVTIPDLCRETWRIEMISERQQRTMPFASYGGQHMNVAYATQGMDHDRKLMSMRGNNIHFTRIVTPHELMPGHHLQSYMVARHNTHRQNFRTPFAVEGWALYWEMLLWDMGYARGPEDRIGMLFWRMHRAARIIVSLKFHLGQMTPPEMIDFLVDRVGHEREPATSEVRRYIGGGYGPLYQCAYMIGGLQLRALHAEVVGAGRMTNREFHDAILKLGAIPGEMLRASLVDVPLTPDYEPQWQFAGEISPAEPQATDDD
ncbi:MAG: DUF885 domain-containing protein [Planctomycetes bacterium]|nr:DUF885 domain-containing protein [Planctomycetota bacterium]